MKVYFVPVLLMLFTAGAFAQPYRHHRHRRYYHHVIVIGITTTTTTSDRLWSPFGNFAVIDHGSLSLAFPHGEQGSGERFEVNFSESRAYFCHAVGSVHRMNWAILRSRRARDQGRDSSMPDKSKPPYQFSTP